jgi:membrane protein
VRVPRIVRSAGSLLAEAFGDWQKDNAPRLGAALAYYTLFSLAPLLIIAIAVAGLAFGRQAAQGHLFTELQSLLGAAGAEAAEQMIENSRKPESGILATVTALVTLLLGASGAFGELKGALNIVWNVPAPTQPGGLVRLIRERLASFAMVLGVGFLLLVSLVFSAAISAADGALVRWLPGMGVAAQALNLGTSVVAITVLFALLFKFLPDTPIAWADVWVGAALTSLLFTGGKYLIGLYLGRGTVASAYGAAGSVVVLVAWIYYAAQIFLFGAELTQAYARRRRATPASV